MYLCIKHASHLYAGTALYKNGTIVEGSFKTNLINGYHITVNYRNGDVYQGGFVKNKRHGKGKMIYHDGGFYEGKFRNGKVKGEFGELTSGAHRLGFGRTNS